MEKEHILVFTDISVLVNRLQNLLLSEGIKSMVKDNVESARLGGYGSFQNSVELYILNSDIDKATPIIENFKKEIAE
ncbi:MAG: DUF2007 domain-containing protein [Flavobacteriaceae bacterium]|nr:DUF2007 domain-containing protein [Flavobacteriaceae bacterium]